MSFRFCGPKGRKLEGFSEKNKFWVHFFGLVNKMGLKNWAFVLRFFTITW